MYDKYRSKADFYWIYVREAHPVGSRRAAKHVKIEQPDDFEERLGIAKGCGAELDLGMPQLVDDMRNSVARAYNAMPDRLFILDSEGKVAYRGARGPKGFKVAEMESALQRLVSK